MCTPASNSELLFTWEISRNAEGRRWFYEKLKSLISGIPEEDWRKAGGSVYIVKKQYAREFEKLLSEFESQTFIWWKFTVENEFERGHS